LHFHASVFVEALPAIVAEAGAEVILFPAAPAAVAEFSRRHGKEKSVISFDDFHIADDEGVVEGQRAKSLEASCLRAAQIDANLRELHICSCSRWRLQGVSSSSPVHWSHEVKATVNQTVTAEMSSAAQRAPVRRFHSNPY